MASICRCVDGSGSTLPRGCSDAHHQKAQGSYAHGAARTDPTNDGYRVMATGKTDQQWRPVMSEAPQQDQGSPNVQGSAEKTLATG